MDALNTREQHEARSVGEQAAEWLLRLEDGDATDREHFSDWLRKSPLHIAAFLRAATMDTLLSRVDRKHTVAVERQSATEDGLDISPEPRSTRPIRKVSRTWRWVAAAAIVFTVFASWLKWHGEASQRFGTRIGEQRVLELEDGSVLHLNTDSQVLIRFNSQERRVELQSGEALFRIQRDPSRPFRVHSGAAVIEAVGTQFNVYRRQDDALVSVIEGAVRILKDSERAAAASGAVRLDAGEEVRIASNGNLSKKMPTDFARISAWRQRRLIFKNEPLSFIAAEFNRYNRTPQIRIEGERAGERRYAAAFDADDPESLLGILEKDPTLKVEQQAGQIVVRER